MTLEQLPPLRSVIEELELSARKSLGQNFLLDLNLTRRIAREAGPLACETVRELGPVAYETEAETFLAGQIPSWKPRTYGDGTAEVIDHAVRKLIEEAFDKAKDILSRYRQTLITRSKELLEKETMDQDELTSIAAEIQQAGGEKPSSATEEGRAA